MTTVKVGQVWLDKDKRRERTVKIIGLGESEVHVQDVITENESSLKLDRFVKRWELIEDVATEATLVEAAEAVRDGKAKLILKGDNDREVIVPERTRAKQPVYQLKVVCQVNEDYKVRLTRKMIEEFGLPICPCHKLEMEEV